MNLNVWVILSVGIISCQTADLSAQIVDILARLIKAVEFYEDNAEEANVDALYGLRVVEGSVATVRLSMDEAVSRTLQKQVATLLDKTRRMIQLVEPAVKRNHAQTYEALKFLVSKPYQAKFVARSVRSDLVWQGGLFEKKFDEPSSDRCFALVFQSRSRGSCEVDKACMEMMTAPGLSSYSLLHQILFLVQLDSLLPVCEELWTEARTAAKFRNMSHIQQVFCSNSYHEMRGLTQKESLFSDKIFVEADDQDLFFEHLFACPSLGFIEFLQPKFLSVFYTSQAPNGCFQDIRVQRKSSRRLMEEVELADGCLFHKTAVAMGALSQYMLVYMLQAYRPNQLQLDGSRVETRLLPPELAISPFAIVVSTVSVCLCAVTLFHFRRRFMRLWLCLT